MFGRSRTARVRAVAVALVVTAASVQVGCSDHDGSHGMAPAPTTGQAGKEPEARTGSTAPAAGSRTVDPAAESKANAEDAMYVEAMIPHHEGAIKMAELSEERSKRNEVRQLSAAILKTQSAEIDQLESMSRGLSHYAQHSGHGSGGMSDHEMGMDGDPSELRKAKDFDRAFVEMMIPHHEGAVRMSQRVIERGKDPKVRELARRVIATQNDEIARMKSWLRSWYGVG